MQQQNFGFEYTKPSKQESEPLTATLPPSAQESEQVATEVSLPPPLVRPDRQIVYPDADSHYDWPSAKELHDRDTMTVDRTGCDIDGPPHRFVIKRGDTVELFRSRVRTELGVVTGISHKNRQVRVLVPEHLEFDKRAKGAWCFLVEIFPTAEPEPLVDGRPLSERARESTPKTQALPYTLDDWKTFQKKLTDGTLTLDELKADFDQLIATRDAFVAGLQKSRNAIQLQNMAANLGTLRARQNTKSENGKAIHRSLLKSFYLGGSIRYSPTQETFEEKLISLVVAQTPSDLDAFYHECNAEQEATPKTLTNPENLGGSRSFINASSVERASNCQKVRSKE